MALAAEIEIRRAFMVKQRINAVNGNETLVIPLICQFDIERFIHFYIKIVLFQIVSARLVCYNHSINKRFCKDIFEGDIQMAEKLKLGLVGLGQRGGGHLKGLFIPSDRVEVAAVCDIYPDRTEKAVKDCTDAGKKAPFATCDYKELINRDKVDLVVIATPWKQHVPMVLYALEQGVACGSEVGGAESLDECFSLVETWEKTRTPYMFLENCRYGRREMMALNMVKKGVFGEIVHCSGGYHHDLREEIGFGRENRHYR